MIGHVGLLRAFSFTRSIRGSGRVQGIYPQTCPDGWRLGIVPNVAHKQRRCVLYSDCKIIGPTLCLAYCSWRDAGPAT